MMSLGGILDRERLWIEDEGEGYPATKVVVREADVLLWLEDEDEPWDTLRHGLAMWRLDCGGY